MPTMRVEDHLVGRVLGKTALTRLQEEGARLPGCPGEVKIFESIPIGVAPGHASPQS